MHSRIQSPTVIKIFIELDLILLNRFDKAHVTLLSRGVDYWNQFREEKPNFIFNLSGADLSNFNLRNINFTETNLSGANLTNTDLRDANLGRANLRGANLSGTNLRDAWLRDAFLDGANLSGANLRDTNLQDTDLRNVLDLRYADMIGANLEDADLREANLSGADLREANLRGANLSSANLTRTNFSGASLLQSNIFQADLSEAILVQADLNGADFRGANLTNANLTRTQSVGTNFQEAIFTGACIEYWNIKPPTNLDGIICDYIYERNDKQERRPSSGKFQHGDFTHLYQRVIETLDLIFQDGIELKSFAVKSQELNNDQKLNVEDENSQLTICEIKTGDDGSVTRVNVPISSDEAEIKNKAKKRTVNALKSGGIAALEKAINNPIGAFLKGAFEGWNNAK